MKPVMGKLLAPGIRGAMRIMEKLIALDGRLLAATDGTYLWLFDRTGVPKGAIVALTFACGVMANYHGGLVERSEMLCGLFWMGAFGLVLVAAQSFGSHSPADQDPRDFATWLKTLPPTFIGYLRGAIWRRIAWSSLFVVCPIEWAMNGRYCAPTATVIILYVVLARTRGRRPPRRRRSGVHAPAAS